MNWFSRGVRNAFRNATRTTALVVIIGLSIGLALSMLIANQAVSQKIDSVKSSVDNTVSIFPAGLRGFAGGGTPLTQSQLKAVSSEPHVTKLDETLSDRLTSSDTNLSSAISAGSLGRRFAGNGFAGGNGGFAPNFNFTPPVTVNGTTDPTNLGSSSATTGGGSFSLKSGSVINGLSDADVAMVGSALAAKNNLKVGSTFTAYNTTFTVSGIFSTGTKFGDNQVIMPLATVQRLSGQVGDVTAATAYVDSISNLSSVTSKIKQILGSSADVTNSEQQAQTAVSSLQSIQTVSLYSLVGAVIAGAVIVLMSMVMIVRERRREIGIIKAMGSSNLRLFGQFMAESVTLTLIAAVLGIIIGTITSNPITQMLVSNSSTGTSVRAAGPGGGFGFARHFGGLAALRGDVSTIHAAVGYGIIGYGLLAAVVIAIIGTLAATYFIAQVRPAEVMRVE